jgi:hypothetical protein
MMSLDLFIGFLLGLAVSGLTLSYLMFTMLFRRRPKPLEDDPSAAPTPSFTSKSRARRTAALEDGGLLAVGEELQFFEKAEWLNMLAARLFSEVTEAPAIQQHLWQLLDSKLNEVDKPKLIGPIVIEDLNLGEALPRIEAVSTELRPGKELELVLDLSYRGGALFSVSTEVWIDLPTMERLASLPVTLTVSSDSFRGKVSLVIPLENNPAFTLSLVEEPQLQLNIGSQIGYEYQLQDVPKISNFIVNKIKSLIREEAVLPKAFSFRLPLFGDGIDLKQVLRESRERPAAVISNSSKGSSKVALRDRAKREKNNQRKAKGIDKCS